MERFLLKQAKDLFMCDKGAMLFLTSPWSLLAIEHTYATCSV